MDTYCTASNPCTTAEPNLWAKKRRRPKHPAPTIAPLFFCTRLPTLRRARLCPIDRHRCDATCRRDLEGITQRSPLIPSARRRPGGDERRRPPAREHVEPLLVELPRHRLRDAYQIRVQRVER